MNNRPIIYIFRPEDEWIEKVGGAQKARQLIDSFRMKSIRDRLR